MLRMHQLCLHDERARMLTCCPGDIFSAGSSQRRGRGTADGNRRCQQQECWHYWWSSKVFPKQSPHFVHNVLLHILYFSKFQFKPLHVNLLYQTILVGLQWTCPSQSSHACESTKDVNNESWHVADSAQKAVWRLAIVLSVVLRSQRTGTCIYWSASCIQPGC